MSENEVRYTQDIADKLCAVLSDGKSLRTACNMPGMPSRQAVFKWLRTNDEFVAQYTAAKREGADAQVDDMQDISDNPNLDHNHKRIMVDTRKWIASKLKPKVYGDKIAVSGDEDGAPLVVTWAAPGK